MDARVGAQGAVTREDVRVADAPTPVIPDEELFDQDGARVRLGDLVQGRTVAVNFVFTTCSTICSPMTANFSRLQTELGDALERDVRLVSISLDPGVDTPEKLKHYADLFGRRKGWTFLTGRSDRVARMRKALGGDAGVKGLHEPLTIIGRGDRWRRVEGIAGPRRLVEEIEGLGGAAWEGVGWQSDR